MTGMNNANRAVRMGWLVATLLVGVLLRAALLDGYPPQSAPDTSTYFQAANDLVSGDFSIGQGRRTPGYPVLVAAMGESPSAIIHAQMAVGLVMSAALFGIASLLGAPPVLAAAAALSYHLNLQQLFQEGALLTETLSAATVAVALWLLLYGQSRMRQGRSVRWLLLLAGVMAGWAILVRPQFLLMAAVLPALVVYGVSGWRWPTLRALRLAAWSALPAVLMVLVWCSVVYTKVGYFTMSTQPGFGLVNHTIDYIERAPDEYANVREVLLRTREARMAEVGHSRNTIWYALPEIRRVTGWSLPEASRQLQKMCVQMFLHNPGTHLRSVVSAWIDFWTVPIFWQPAALPAPGLAAVLQRVWSVEHWALRLANLGFVLVVACALVLPAARRRLRWDAGLTAIAATVLGSSLIQALADQGASSRYAVPTQAVVVVFLLVVAWRWRRPAAGTTTTRA